MATGAASPGISNISPSNSLSASINGSTSFIEAASPARAPSSLPSPSSSSPSATTATGNNASSAPLVTSSGDSMMAASSPNPQLASFAVGRLLPPIPGSAGAGAGAGNSGSSGGLGINSGSLGNGSGSDAGGQNGAGGNTPSPQSSNSASLLPSQGPNSSSSGAGAATSGSASTAGATNSNTNSREASPYNLPISLVTNGLPPAVSSQSAGPLSAVNSNGGHSAVLPPSLSRSTSSSSTSSAVTDGNGNASSAGASGGGMASRRRHHRAIGAGSGGSGSLSSAPGMPFSGSGSFPPATAYSFASSSGAANVNTSVMMEEIKRWSMTDVSNWLSSNKLGNYVQTFVSNDIAGAVLLDVDQAALKEMGITSVGDRIRVYNAIKTLKRKCAEDAVMRRMSIVSASSTGTMLSSSTGSSGIRSALHGLAAGTSATGAAAGNAAGVPNGVAIPASQQQQEQQHADAMRVGSASSSDRGFSTSSNSSSTAHTGSSSSLMGSHITIGGGGNSSGLSSAGSSFSGSSASAGGTTATTSFLQQLQAQQQQQQSTTGRVGGHLRVEGEKEAADGEMEVLDTKEYHHPYAAHPYASAAAAGGKQPQNGGGKEGGSGTLQSNNSNSSSVGGPANSSGVGLGTPVGSRRLAQSRPPPLHLTKSAANAPSLAATSTAAQQQAAQGRLSPTAPRPLGIGSNRGVSRSPGIPSTSLTQQQQQQHHRKVASAGDMSGLTPAQAKTAALVIAQREQQPQRPGTGPGGYGPGLSNAAVSIGTAMLGRPNTSSGVSSHPAILRPGGLSSASPTQQNFGARQGQVGLGLPSINEGQPRTPTSATMDQYGRTPTTPGTPYSASLAAQQQYAIVQHRSSGGDLISPLSLEDLKRRTMKFIGDDGTSRIVAVSDCKDSWEVLARVLKKFGKPPGGNSYMRNADSVSSPMEADLAYDGSLWRIAATSGSGEVKLLDDDELLAICQSPQVDDPLRERGLRLMRINEFLDDGDMEETSSSSRRPFKASRNKLEAFFGERVPGASSTKLEAFFGERVPTAQQQATQRSPNMLDEEEMAHGTVVTNGKRVNRASTANILHALSGSSSPGPVAGPRPPAPRKPIGGPAIIPRRARNFFGQRPPSELISSHLQDFFPATEKRVLERTARRSIYGRSIYRTGSTRSRRDSTYSFVPDSDAPPLPGKEEEPEMPIIHIDARSAQSANIDSPPTLPPVVGRSSLDDWSANLHALGSPVAEVPSGPTSRSTPSSIPRPASIRRRSGESSRSRKSIVSSRMRVAGPEVDKSDNASLLTVDEITQEVQSRRDSVHHSRPGSIRPSSPRSSMLAATDEEDTDDGEGNSSPNIAERRSIFSAYDHSAGPTPSTTIEEAAIVHGPPSHNPLTTELRSDLVESGSDEDEVDFEDELTESEYDEEDEDFEEPGEERIKWIKGALIGAGSFGNVYLGMNQRTGIIMAVKQVELPRGESHSDKRKKGMLEALEREIELLKSLQHPNIVQYLDSYADGTHLNIFLEYVPGGSVAALLNNYGALQEGLVRKFTKQILEGLSFLHAREIVHRDIKGANILVDTASRVKISDFGISKKVESNLLAAGGAHRPSLQGSVFWMAPEVVKQTSYTRKADIWSLGCLVVEMISGTHPWANLNQMQALFKIGSSAKPTLPDLISAQAIDFLNKTFEIDHNLRPDADELLKHPFVTADFSEEDASGGLPGANLSGTTLNSGSSSTNATPGKGRSKGAGRKRLNTASLNTTASATTAPPPPSKD